MAMGRTSSTQPRGQEGARAIKTCPLSLPLHTSLLPVFPPNRPKWKPESREAQVLPQGRREGRPGGARG